MKLKLLILSILALSTLSFGQELPKFKVKKWEFTNANAERTKRMDKALLTFEKVMNNEDFQEELLKETFSFAKKDPNRTLTTRQIVEKIYAAKESFNTKANNQADIYWNIRTEPSPKPPCRVTGSTSRSNKWINTYSCFIKKSTKTSSITRHIAHEWTHKFGFIDTGIGRDLEVKTFPYIFGKLVKKYAEKYN